MKKDIDKIAILDCGGQYTKVIDRRVREFFVRPEIFAIGIKAEELEGYQGIILSGGPGSVWSLEKLKYDSNIFNLDIPVLGICYGMHLLNSHFGGKVKPGVKQEYGETVIEIDSDCLLFDGLKEKQKVLMSHGDSVKNLAQGFKIGAVSEGIAACIYNTDRSLYGVQFHPEVDLTENGRKMLNTFLKKICKLKGNYILKSRIESSINKIKEQVGDNKIIVLVSGGVDSAVTAVLLVKALKPEQIYAIHVDHGLMRKNESDMICKNLKSLGLKNIIRVNAKDSFFYKKIKENDEILGPLVNTFDPEEKRRIIGNFFVEVVKEKAKDLGLDFDEIFLAQGTLRPDLIESGNPDVSSYAQKIKTHHNDVDIIRQVRKHGRIVETNWDWHKDEVRKIARNLGIEEKIASRQPFPGPGLAIRYICNAGKTIITEDQDKKFRDILKSSGADENQITGSIVPLKTVGVQGDNRSHRYLSILYSDKTEQDWNSIFKIGTFIPNNLNFINRVAYVLNKNTTDINIITNPKAISEVGIELLRNIDAYVREALEKPPMSQVFAVLLPMHTESEEKKYSIAIRTFITNDYMTGRPALIGEDVPLNTVTALSNSIEKDFKEIDLIIYDITSKPPATVEWE